MAPDDREVDGEAFGRRREVTVITVGDAKGIVAAPRWCASPSSLGFSAGFC